MTFDLSGEVALLDSYQPIFLSKHDVNWSKDEVKFH